MMKKLLGSPVLIPCLLVMTVSLRLNAYADERKPYQLQISQSEARDALLGILDNVSSTDPSAEDAVAKLVRAYRGGVRPDDKLTILNGPFVGLVVSGDLTHEYASLYVSAKAEAYKENVTDVNTEGVFNDFLQAVTGNQIPADQKDLVKAAKQMGMCMARKALSAAGKACTLEDDSHLEKPSLLKLIWAKTTCGMGWVSPCEIRRTIFQQAKKQLIDAKKAGVLDKIFEAQYPSLFQKGLMDKVNSTRAKLGELISGKFAGLRDALWDAPLIELPDSTSRSLTMHEFASGLKADTVAASFLSQTDDPELRGIASALFYASANRQLVMMGGAQARWNGGAFEFDPTYKLDPAHPMDPPIFVVDGFGGIDAHAGPKSPLSSPWDVANYDPTVPANPAQAHQPIRLFPSAFELGPTGGAHFEATDQPVETLGDVADLLDAEIAFLNATHDVADPAKEDATPLANLKGLAAHFGDGVANILDPTKRVVFPTDGRQIAVGIIAAMMKNVITPVVGHAEKADAGALRGGKGLAFYGNIGLSGRSQDPTPTRDVARLVSAASELRELIDSGDPAIPAALVANKTQITDAVTVGAWTLEGIQGQASDGGFMNNLGDDSTPHDLRTSTEAMIAINRAFIETGIAGFSMASELAWKHMDGFWQAGSIVPRLTEGQNHPERTISAPDLWRLITLWDETLKSPLYEDLLTRLPNIWPAVWAKWSTRMEALRNRLKNQLNTPDGPQGIRELSS